MYIYTHYIYNYIKIYIYIFNSLHIFWIQYATKNKLAFSADLCVPNEHCPFFGNKKSITYLFKKQFKTVPAVVCIPILEPAHGLKGAERWVSHSLQPHKAAGPTGSQIYLLDTLHSSSSCHPES